MESLREHAEIIITVMGIIISGLVTAAYRDFVRWRKNLRTDSIQWRKELQEKMEEFMKAHHECQKGLPHIYQTKADFQKWADELHEDRKARWDNLSNTINRIFDKIENHSHGY